jgi:hypothetical protein
MINKQINPEQNNRSEESCSPALLAVKIPHAEPGDSRTHLWSKGQGQTKRGRLEDQNKEQISKISLIYDNKYKNTKHNNRREVKVIVQHYSMVKLPCALCGDRRNIIMWMERQETKRNQIRRLEQ